MDLDVVAIRLITEKTLRNVFPEVTSSNAAAKIFEELLGDLDREVMALLTLDTAKRPINVSIVSMGTLNNTLVHPREIFKTALLSNADSIVLAHNHPDGQIEPSKMDEQLTERLIEAGKILGIDVIDHIIIGAENYYSFFENDCLPISVSKYMEADRVKAPEIKMVQKRLDDILESKKTAQARQIKKPVIHKNTDYRGLR